MGTPDTTICPSCGRNELVSSSDGSVACQNINCNYTAEDPMDSVKIDNTSTNDAEIDDLEETLFDMLNI